MPKKLITGGMWFANVPKRETGFTLLELLIAIAIIGLLSSMAYMGFQNTKTKGRDTRRITDINAIFSAVNMYSEENTAPPDPAIESWASLEADLASYLQSGELPLDPSESSGYHYVYCHSGLKYLLATVLEDDKEIDNEIDGVHGYTEASECIFSGGTTNSLDCADIAGSGDVAGISGSVFCVGSAK